MKTRDWVSMADRLSEVIRKHPACIVGIAILGSILSVWYASGHLEFWTERSVLLSTKSDSALRYKAYRAEVPDDYLILVAESRDLDTSKRFADLLGTRLAGESAWIKDIFFRIQPERFRRQALLFLDPEQLRQLRRRLEDNRRFLFEVAEAPDLSALFRAVDDRIWIEFGKALVDRFAAPSRHKDLPPPSAGTPPAGELSFLSSLLDSLYFWIREGGNYKSPWNLLSPDGVAVSEDGFLVDASRGWVFVLVYPNDEGGSFDREGATLERIREHIRDVSLQLPNVRVGITGTPALNSEEMASSLKDMTLAMWLALALIAALFLAGFAQVKRPLMALLVLLMGAAWTLGWVGLTVGHLNILSMAFGSILLGLGIDFGIHVIACYERETREGCAPAEAIQRTLRQTGRAVLSSGLTTMAAFLALCISSFLGLREFGWIAGWGILFCMAASMVVLPSLLFLSDRAKSSEAPARRGRGHAALGLERFLAAPSRYPRSVLAFSLLLTLCSLLSWPRVRFDYNLLHLQPTGTEAVEWEDRLIEAQGNSSIFAVDMVDSLEEARRRSEAYAALPLVGGVESLANYLPKDTQARLDEIGKIREAISPFPGGRPDRPSTLSMGSLRSRIAGISYKLQGLANRDSHSSSWGKDRESSVSAPDTRAGVGERAARLHETLRKEHGPHLVPSLLTYQEELFSDLQRKLDLFLAALDPLPLTFEDLPEFLQKRLRGLGGQYIIQIYPRENVWEPEAQKRFVAQLRTVNEQVTGPAVVNYESTKALVDAYVQGGAFALTAILLILFLDFRRPALVLLTLTPLVLSAVWTAFWMRLAGISFNPANLVIIPLLAGMGVDNGIHVVRRFLAASSPDEEIAGTSMGRAITLCALTTMAGFGSLMVARHQGIHSIGALLTIAMGSCLFASLVVLPSVIKVLPRGLRHGLWSGGRAHSSSRQRI